MSKITQRLAGRTAIAALLAASALGASMFALAGTAHAVDVKSIAIMTPDDPTDQGWNQQGYDAAKAVADKYKLTLEL